MDSTTDSSGVNGTEELTPVVQAIGAIRLDGNITPHSWYQHPKLRTSANKPHNVAMALLADVVYWYRPVILRDESTGQILSVRKKFESDKWRIDYAQWAATRGYGKRQVQDAANFLKHQGIVTLECRDHTTPTGYTIYNAVFIEPVPAAIEELNHIQGVSRKNGIGVPKKRDTPHEKTGQVSRKNATGVPKKRAPRTESTPKTPSENSSSPGRDAPDDASFASLVSELQTAGVSARIAKELAREFPDECRHQLDYLPHRNVPKPGAYLPGAIRDAYDAPKGAQKAADAPQRPAVTQDEAEAAERVYEAMSASQRRTVDDSTLSRAAYIKRFHWDELAREMGA